MKQDNVLAEPMTPGWFLAADGRWRPPQHRSQVDELRDQTVRDLVGRCQAASAELSRLKAQLFADLASHVQLSAEAYGVRLSGRTGNVTLHSTDGTLRIERVVSPRMRVGVDILAAERLVSELLDDLTTDADPTLRALVEQMFRRDAAGSISPSRLLEFIRLDLEEPRWKRAQEVVRQSLEADGSVIYFRAYQRADECQPWALIPLDFSRIPFVIEPLQEAPQ